ncbi:molybdopterin molybdotransferase MoeA [Psychrosphaera sp. B3R10]|uniref:molybdopterin molybdotransferase MoeA n=1 Tax=unclassified Psychrosphaera TaxID=2641570 RepID=UPI001C081438|nr:MULTISPECIES: gephyrin-like molybdotransferase Glp [unclassified Psychrosphaera]MBU2881696.1 molybdopterin molybdotransferase MoeA [Psychrosphaera sp. I2R16]MBU2991049.1 molybdopterin molybdotransferase MoeA [Psychrosphaera sp. B3R10]
MLDSCSAPSLLPVNDALAKLQSAVQSVTSTIKINIDDSDGRILSEDVVATVNVPPVNNSAMDGYAVNLVDLSSDKPKHSSNINLVVVGAAMAGNPYTGRINQGECIRIMTGAPVPTECNAVVMQENVVRQDDVITLSKVPVLHDNIRFCGEDIKTGETLFSAGHKIRSVDIGMMASLGIANVTVFQPLTVAVFSTGDELKLPGETLNVGDIYDSNRQTVKAMLKRLNVDVIDLGVIPDNIEAIKNAFIKADQDADAIISSGGVSVGDADFTKDVLSEIGDINFWKVAMKPGKPFAFGLLPNSVFFGLPGNPVSATVTFDILVAPTIIKMMGALPTSNMELTATTLTALKKRPGRADFQRGVASVNQQGQLEVTALNSQGSGILSSMCNANCYILLTQNDGRIEAGAQVKIRMFNSLLA